MTNKLFRLMAGWCLVLGFVVSPLLAQQAPNEAEQAAEAQPAVDAAEGVVAGQPLEITITLVQGNVEYRADEQQPWQPAEEGMILGVGAEFRTAFRSRVVFTMPPDQTITLKRPGFLKVLEAIRIDDQNVKTDLGMTFGNATYDVTEAGVTHDTSITTPSATLAVRGSHGFNINDNNYHQAYAFAIQNPMAVTNNQTGQQASMGSNTTTTSMPTNSNGVAYSSWSNTGLDGRPPGSRTDEEGNLLARYQSQSSSAYGSNSGLLGSLFANASNFQSMMLGMPMIGLPGDLTFVMTWDRRRSDLDFSVLVPANSHNARLLCTSNSIGGNCLSHTSDGWNASNDIKRGPGRELIYKNGSGGTTGSFDVTVHHFAGTQATSFTVEVLKNGKRIRPLIRGNVSSSNPTHRTTVNVP